MSKTIDVFYPKRYQGLWYEVAKTDNEFEVGCEGATANYTMFNTKNSGALFNVINTCYKNQGRNKPYSSNIEQYSLEAQLFSNDMNNPGKLTLNINNVTADYWIYDTDYRNYAIVGSPPDCYNDGYIWLLSRRRYISINTYRMFKQKAKQLGFDTTRISRSKMMTFTKR